MKLNILYKFENINIVVLHNDFNCLSRNKNIILHVNCSLIYLYKLHDYNIDSEVLLRVPTCPTLLDINSK